MVLILHLECFQAIEPLRVVDTCGLNMLQFKTGSLIFKKGEAMKWKSSLYFGQVIFERVHEDSAVPPPVHPAIRQVQEEAAHRAYRDRCATFFAARPHEKRDEVSGYEDGRLVTYRRPR